MLSLGYPEHSNWQRGFGQCSNFTGFTHPTNQTNKQTNKQTKVVPEVVQGRRSFKIPR
jgi:hypothetical protein